MNDNFLEMFEEFQSDSIDELVIERKKNRAIQSLLHSDEDPVRYYYLKNDVNGRSVKCPIDASNLDSIARISKDSKAKEQQHGDILFYSTIPVVLKYEGGYVDNPNDRGGKTNMGVTQGFLHSYKERAGVTADDVTELTKDDALKLYKAHWDAFGFGKLDNPDVTGLVYDFSVNSGAGTAIKYLQKALNKKGHNLVVDGYIGEKTNNAVNAVDEEWLKREIQKSRAEHCDRIVDKDPTQQVFIKGWFRRINEVGNKYGCDATFNSRHINR